MKNPHRWDLNDPFLYTVAVTSNWKDAGAQTAARDGEPFNAGIRDFRVVDGYFSHIPSDLVVTCQNERSQIKNRASAMGVLKSRLYELELNNKRTEMEKHYGEKGEVGLGRQIRSYVLQPYQMVKNLRTGEQTSDVQATLDGDLNKFIESFHPELVEGSSRAAQSATKIGVKLAELLLGFRRATRAEILSNKSGHAGWQRRGRSVFRRSSARRLAVKPAGSACRSTCDSDPTGCRGSHARCAW
jgi:hypothetical protein